MIYHVKWVPCHRGMTPPQVADGGDGLQVWRVAANILNKQSGTADKGWSSSVGLQTSHRKTSFSYKMLRSASNLMDYLDTRPKLRE
jgi:hypothetical protein